MSKTGGFKNSILLVLIVGGTLFSPKVLAEDEIPFDVNSTTQDDSSYEKALKESAPQIREVRPATKNSATPKAEDSGLTGLGNLSAFSDIAVINKRFLPKTGRFELFPNIGMVINDAFFTDFSYGLRAAYYFSENYGVELTGSWISSSNKTVTNELAADSIQTNAFATPTTFYGLDFKWSPLYGKMGFMNRSITPFDIYLSLGGGVTATNQSTSPPTLHLGVGEMYALSKWTALRVDISYYAYSSTSQVSPSGSSTSSSYSNIYATIGMSFLFPDAEYR